MREESAPDILLSAAEITSITGGYTRKGDQLRVLHERGFFRAAILRGHLVLERSHYEAVTRAQLGEPTTKPRPMLKSQRLKSGGSTP